MVPAVTDLCCRHGDRGVAVKEGSARSTSMRKHSVFKGLPNDINEIFSRTDRKSGAADIENILAVAAGKKQFQSLRF